MTNFVWTSFGTLVNVSKSPTMVLIENVQGQVLKMSLSKYQESAIEVYQKAQQLVGKAVTVRTSQNTGDWSTSEWFSDLKLEQENMTHQLGDLKKVTDKNKCLSCQGKGFYLYAGGKRKNTCSNCDGTGIRKEFRVKRDKPFNAGEERGQIDRESRSLTDYSKSYVDGDLGYINTKFWNGN